jgi:hypothetical protein
VPDISTRLILDTVGIALIVGGAAFVLGGLIFFIRSGDDRSVPEAAIEDMRQRVDQKLGEMRKNRGELPR